MSLTVKRHKFNNGYSFYPIVLWNTRYVLSLTKPCESEQNLTKVNLYIQNKHSKDLLYSCYMYPSYEDIGETEYTLIRGKRVTDIYGCPEKWNDVFANIKLIACKVINAFQQSELKEIADIPDVSKVTWDGKLLSADSSSGRIPVSKTGEESSSL